ncbi:MAG: hypothetical protein ACE5EI_04305 [Thermodesulfobacteriota bacterium]
MGRAARDTTPGGLVVRGRSVAPGAWRTLRAVLCCIIVLALFGCSRPSEEQRVRNEITGAARAIEAKDLKAFMSRLSRGFTDDHGNDRDMVKSILFGRFMRREDIRVFITSLDVEVKGTVARADIRLVVAVGPDLSAVRSARDAPPEDVGFFEVSAVFRKEGGEWLAVGANWVAAGTGGIL